VELAAVDDLDLPPAQASLEVRHHGAQRILGIGDRDHVGYPDATFVGREPRLEVGDHGFNQVAWTFVELAEVRAPGKLPDQPKSTVHNVGNGVPSNVGIFNASRRSAKAFPRVLSSARCDRRTRPGAMPEMIDA